jgi:hypothetical protein
MLAEELNGTAEIQARVRVRDGYHVVFVSNYSCNLRMADISCDFTNDGWWFTWVADGRAIGPAADMAGVAESVVTYLHRPMSL